MNSLRGYEQFYKLPPGTATLAQVHRSSAGVHGWALYARALSTVSKDSDGDRKLAEILAKQDELLDKLGIKEEIMAMDGVKRVRFAENVSDGGTLKTGYASDNQLIESSEVEDDSCVLNSEVWQDVEFEVALDSGSQDHVCDEVDCPGYMTEQSPGTSRGQCFIVGNGGRLDNLGQRSLNLEPFNDASTPLSSCFQIARVTRPLMSVGRICDNGMKVEFDDKQAVVRDAEGQQVCVFERKPGGLYTCKFRLKSPTSGFARRE